MRLFIAAAMVALTLGSGSLQAEPQWQPLFNGKNLSGWDKYISMQPPTNDSKFKPTQIRGLNNDPKKVFSVVDGSIRISGEEWGALTTRADFDNFDLVFEMKWGDKRWPPRQDALRDSGLLYFAVGPHGAQSGHWMRSHEFQIQEGDCGDYHSLDGALVDAPVGDANQGDWKFYRYDPSAPVRQDLHERILKLGNYEKPRGEWNTMEIIADGKTLIHKVNGHEVLRLTNSRQLVNGQQLPLARGKIQLQSEGAEVFYRNIKIRQLQKPAAAY